MTAEEGRPLPKFGKPNPFARRRTETRPQPAIKVDAVEEALNEAQRMPELVNPKQAAALLSVTERTLERWRIAGDGPPFVRLTRGTVRYSMPALAAFVASRVKKNTGQ